MGITINTNTAAMKALTSLDKTSKSLSKTFSALSTGLRISKAADDAAGLGVAENLKAASHSADVAARNINDGISVISVAEGASSQVGDILTRMRELAVQGASDTLDTNSRGYIQNEFAALSSEVDRISGVSEFNGTTLTDGSTASINVQVGIHATANDQVAINLGDLTAATLGVDTGSIDMSTAAGCSSALANIDTAITTVSSYRSDYGAVENRLNSALENIQSFSENTKAAESSIRDVDFGAAAADLTKNQMLQQAGMAVLGQAKNINQGALNLLQ